MSVKKSVILSEEELKKLSINEDDSPQKQQEGKSPNTSCKQDAESSDLWSRYLIDKCIFLKRQNHCRMIQVSF